MPFELLDHLDGPCEMALAIAAIDLDAIGRILVVQLMLNGPFEQGGHGVLEMTALVWRAADMPSSTFVRVMALIGRSPAAVSICFRIGPRCFRVPALRQLAPIARMTVQVDQPADRALAIFGDQRRWRDRAAHRGMVRAP